MEHKASILGVCAGKARFDGTFDPGTATLSFTRTYLEGMFSTPVHYRGQVKNSRLVEGT